MRAILVPLSWIYGLVMLARNVLFDLGLFRVGQAGVPVIAVGNMTAGGTGKTPLVEYLVGHLLGLGVRVGVVSRGYGRTSRGVVIVSDGTRVLVPAQEGGDEAVQLARRFPAAVVVVAERRVEGARVAVTSLGAEVLVLDDAFQHRYLRRDLDIVVLDARVDINRERLLPAGRRREPLRGLRRAGVVAFSKLAEGQTVVSWIDALRTRSSAPVVMFRTVPTGLRWASDGVDVPVATIRSASVVALSGIADNVRFVEDLRTLGVTVQATLGFGDHHRYAAADIDRILETVRRSGAAYVVTTEKDLPRLQGGPGRRLLEEASVMVLPVAVRWVEGEEVILSAVTGILTNKDRA